MKNKKNIIILIILLAFVIYFVFSIVDRNNKMDSDSKVNIDKEYSFGDAYFPGDVNGNNRLDANDYKLIVRYIIKTATLNDNQLKAADANGDGKVNPVDYKTIVRKILNHDTNPPVSTVTPVQDHGYDVTIDSRFDGYANRSSCTSETMNFRIISKNGEYYTLVWVKDAASQFGVGLAGYNGQGTDSGSSILGSHVGSGCAVGVNGSLFANGTITGGVVINGGRIVKDTGKSEGLIGMSYKGFLGEYSHMSASDILSAGVINTVGISSSASVDNSNVSTGRTQICQIDIHNFVIFTGSGTVSDCGSKVSSFTGCSYVYNLDGGGSRKLYYQTKSEGLTSIIDGGRAVFDMVYFKE